MGINASVWNSGAYLFQKLRLVDGGLAAQGIKVPNGFARCFDFDERDERDEGVKTIIRMAVEGARSTGCHSGLCGQAPSDYPDTAEFIVAIGIDSMSLTPGTVIKSTQRVLETEQRCVKGLE